MTISKPKTDAPYPDRDLDCQQEIEPVFLALICAATAQGWTEMDVAQALVGLAEANRAKVADEEPEL